MAPATPLRWLLHDQYTLSSTLPPWLHQAGGSKVRHLCHHHHHHQHHHHNHCLIITIRIILIIRTASSKGEWGLAHVQADLESAAFVSCFFFLRTILDHQISRVVILSCIYTQRRVEKEQSEDKIGESGSFWFPEVFCLNPTMSKVQQGRHASLNTEVNSHLLVHHDKIPALDMFGQRFSYLLYPKKLTKYSKSKTKLDSKLGV